LIIGDVNEELITLLGSQNWTWQLIVHQRPISGNILSVRGSYINELVRDGQAVFHKSGTASTDAETEGEEDFLVNHLDLYLHSNLSGNYQGRG
jgi:hypothetical protein